MSWQSFVDELAGDAKTASAATGVPASTILAQWGVETGWGTSRAWRRGNNYAGVSPGGRLAYYDTREEGLAAYIRTMNSDYYSSVRAVGAAGDPYAAADALAASPWAEGHYTGGTSLVAALDRILGGSGTARPDASIDPFGIVSAPIDAASGLLGGLLGGLTSDLAKDVGRVVLTGIFISGGLVLVALGAWRTVTPIRERVASETATIAPAAGAAA